MTYPCGMLVTVRGIRCHGYTYTTDQWTIWRESYCVRHAIPPTKQWSESVWIDFYSTLMKAFWAGVPCPKCWIPPHLPSTKQWSETVWIQVYITHSSNEGILSRSLLSKMLDPPLPSSLSILLPFILSQTLLSSFSLSSFLPSPSLPPWDPWKDKKNSWKFHGEKFL